MSETLFALTFPSGNEKIVSKASRLAGLAAAVSTTAPASCPPTCPLLPSRGGACYAGAWPLRLHWDKLTERGLTLAEFTKRLRALPIGTICRLNQAGDIPHVAGHIVRAAALKIARAAAQCRTWTYTHHATTPANLEVLRAMHTAGVVVNLSCDSLAQCDERADLGLPLTVTVPTDWPASSSTPRGLRVVVCPEQTGKVADCASCMLCAAPSRPYVIGFRAHGNRAKKIVA